MKRKFTAKPGKITASVDSTNLLGEYSKWYKVADANDLEAYDVDISDTSIKDILESNYDVKYLGEAIIDVDKLEAIAANELSNEGYDLLAIGQSEDGNVNLYMTFGDGTASIVTLSDIDRIVSLHSYGIKDYPTQQDVHAYIQWVIDGELADNGYEVPEEKHDELFEFVLRELKEYLAYGDLEAWLYVDRNPFDLPYDDCLYDFVDNRYPDSVIEDSVLDYVRDHGYD